MTTYTIGYEGSDLEQFLDSLVRYDVDVLVDVRELPLSRKPGFSKTRLSQALTERGLDYQHLRVLGAPRDIRHRYREDRNWSLFWDAYLDHVRDERDALDALANLAQEKRICLMCFERDASSCHRQILSRWLSLFFPDVQVVHISVNDPNRS